MRCAGASPLSFTSRRSRLPVLRQNTAARRKSFGCFPKLAPRFPDASPGVSPGSNRPRNPRFSCISVTGLRPSTVSFLHRHDLRSDPLHISKGAEFTRDTDARFEVIETRGGMMIGVRRPATAHQLYWRITQWVMPFHTMIPPYGDNALNGHAFVPIDDENCMVWCFTHHPARPLSAHEIDTMRQGGGIHVKLLANSFRPFVNKDNDYMIDRVAQKHHKSYSGVKGIAMQDAAIQESCGPIQDRSKENLVSTDNGVIMARARLRKAALAVVQGEAPDGLDPATHAVRSAAIVLPEEANFYQAAADALVVRQGIAHASV